ncbi:hypothetical protein [Oceanobacillus timonensis]|uniref:hypothetical protein n=1 Tax=Oceanobacillus timonensis TaxID=1926285 RepID=UPI0009BAF6DF|nr:hypothetical protein [Oceanobacillus timonensis]
MYTLVTDKEEKNSLIHGYFILIRNHIGMAMESFLKKEGFRIDSMAILYKQSLDEYEDQEELQEIKDNQVVLLAEYPAASVNEKVYLDFEELYHYLVQVIQEKHKDDETIQRLLLAIKKEWNV